MMQPFKAKPGTSFFDDDESMEFSNSTPLTPFSLFNTNDAALESQKRTQTPSDNDNDKVTPTNKQSVTKQWGFKKFDFLTKGDQCEEPGIMLTETEQANITKTPTVPHLSPSSIQPNEDLNGRYVQEVLPPSQPVEGSEGEKLNHFFDENAMKIQDSVDELIGSLKETESAVDDLLVDIHIMNAEMLLLYKPCFMLQMKYKCHRALMEKKEREE